MRIRIIFTLLVLAIPMGAQTPPPTGIIAYAVDSGDCTSPCIPANFDAFFPSHFTIMVGPGVDLSAYLNPSSIMTTYVDGEFIYAPLVYQFVYGTATTQGFADPEGLLLHQVGTSATDYTVPGGGMFNGSDQFDFYDQTFTSSSGTPTAAVHGAFTLVGSTYTDKTVAIYCATTACSGSASNVTVSDRLLLGYQFPFTLIHVTVQTPIVGGTVSWFYCTATATCSTAVTPSSDGTSGLTTSGDILLPPPPSGWVRSVQNGSQAKYWVELAVTGSPSTSPILSRVWGDNMLTSGKARAWNPSGCAGGTVGTGDLTWCVTPSATATAHSRQQARAIGYGGGVMNDFIGSLNNVQSGKITWAYVNQTRTAAALARQGYAGDNGVMFDNGAGIISQTPAWMYSNSDLNATGGSYTGYVPPAGPMFAALHALLQTQYGSSPKFWDGVNSFALATANIPIYTSMFWTLSELHNAVENSFALGSTGDQLTLCTASQSPLWCPSPGTNPNGTFELMQIVNNQQFSLKDGAPSIGLGNYHLWDMSQRGPMNAVAMWQLVRNPQIWFTYNVSGANYSGFDEYYYFVTAAATLNSSISPSTCAGGCAFTTTTNVASAGCPGAQAFNCTIRIGGTDIVGVAGSTYNASSFTTQLAGITDAILNAHAPGETIEYAVRGHQSISPLVYPIYMWGYNVPAVTVNLGTPDPTNGFGTPCTSNGFLVTGGCIAATGSVISGNTNAVTGCGYGSGPNFHCSPLLRRDFTGGTFGNAIVLLRPVTPSNTPTASSEYDTYSVPYALPGPYYQLNADGSIAGTSVTSVTLRGGESFIGLTLAAPPSNLATRVVQNRAPQNEIIQ